MTKPVTYIASPYTKGDPAINTHFQCRVFNRLLDDDIVLPVIPLTSHFLHLIHPRPYQDWINYDLALIELCDACLRLNAEYAPLEYCVKESKGADGEVARFTELGKPVFYDLDSLYEWARPQRPRQIVALTGYAGAGKDDAAKGLVADGWTRVAFADAVRDAVMAMNPIMDDANRFRDVVAKCGGWDNAKRDSEVRRLLQRMGTEASRNIHGDDCWIKIAKRKIDAAPSNVVITDLRFANEAEAIRSWGGKVIRIDRPGVGPVNGHASEKLEFEADAVINNCGSIEELQNSLRYLAEYGAAEVAA